MEHFLSGVELYGDNFDSAEIAAWYRDEEHGYADLGAKDRSAYAYGYHYLNMFHGFSQIKGMSFSLALGFGSAYGDELIPIETRIRDVALLDASECFRDGVKLQCPTSFHQASQSGDLPFDSAVFDLVTCFGVLHHIPNVTHVVGEIHRCMKSGGILLLREPIITMGDWRFPRPGLTTHERGIPDHLLKEIVEKAGFVIRSHVPCMFPLTSRIGRFTSRGPYNSRWAVLLDSLLSRLTYWNSRYHRVGFFQKIAPTCVYMVLEKAR